MENRDEIIDTIKILIYKKQQHLFEKLNIQDDEVFLEPLLFAYFNSKSNNLYPKEALEEMLQGYFIKKEEIKIAHSYSRDGIAYVQDHTYQFHIALCYLQLNEYKKVEAIFKTDIIAQEKQWNEAHFLDIFYYGISQYEQGKWEEAIFQFDKALEQYSNFSDAKYYKAICLMRLKKYKESKTIMEEAKRNAQLGNTINEANEIYEPYPYQVRW